jgi:PAS domain-containing protein
MAARGGLDRPANPEWSCRESNPVGGSVLWARRWRGLTPGLQLAELAELVRGQAAVLHGIGEGVLAADTSWKTTFVNDEACRLLEIGDEQGSPVEEIGLTPRVLEVLSRRIRRRHLRPSTTGSWWYQRDRSRVKDGTWERCSSCAIAPMSNR